MKRSFSVLLLICLFVLLSFSCNAEDRIKSGLFYYSMKGNGTAVIVGFDAKSNGNNDVYVPKQIDGYMVSEIGGSAFNGAECECVIMLPDTITTIGDQAFYNSSFTAINIPSSVQQIGTKAFIGMKSIERLTVDSQNPVYATIDNVLYKKNDKSLIAYPSTKDISIKIPDGIRSIGESAFGLCVTWPRTCGQGKSVV